MRKNKSRVTQIATWAMFEKEGCIIYCCFDEQTGSMSVWNHNLDRSNPDPNDRRFKFNTSDPETVRKVAQLLLDAAEEGIKKQKLLLPF